VRYRAEHAAGVAPYYVGVRLFPVQLVEAVWVLGVVAVGVLLVLRAEPPGAALAWYVVAYDLGRFGLEFLRGDPGRPYRGDFSSPQWIALVLTWAVVVGGWLDLLPARRWHLGAAVGTVAVMLAVAARRRWRGRARDRLWHPRHVREVAAALTAASGGAIALGETSLGVRISAGRVADAGGVIEHVGISHRDGDLPPEAAAALAELVTVLRRPEVTGPLSGEIVCGGQGVYHLLLRADDPGG
jgi:hypothetical protein